MHPSRQRNDGVKSQKPKTYEPSRLVKREQIYFLITSDQTNLPLLFASFKKGFKELLPSMSYPANFPKHILENLTNVLPFAITAVSNHTMHRGSCHEIL